MVTVDAFGIGELDLDDAAAEQVGAELFPADFPALAASDVLVVGPLQGTLFER
jgi:hypothetical protein